MNSNAIIELIGKAWPEQGGAVGGIMPALDGNPAYALIVSDESLGFAEALIWGPYGYKVEGLSDWDGKANTEILLASDQEHPAAEFCANLKIGEFNDFYLLSRREASVIAGMAPQLIRPGWHWTSSQPSAYGAFFQDFVVGYQYGTGKDGKRRVRAVRKVPIYV